MCGFRRIKLGRRGFLTWFASVVGMNLVTNIRITQCLVFMIATLLVSEDGWPDVWLLSSFVGIPVVQSQPTHLSCTPCC